MFLFYYYCVVIAEFYIHLNMCKTNYDKNEFRNHIFHLLMSLKINITLIAYFNVVIVIIIIILHLLFQNK